jgi:hypothetical protein
MMHKVAMLLGGAMLAGLAGPGLAADCARPAAPAKIDGATATMEQLQAGKAEVTAFMGASDTYQSCLLDDLEAQRKAAKAEKKKLDPAVAKATDAKVSENQADKEKVGADFNSAVKAYKAAHPS